MDYNAEPLPPGIMPNFPPNYPLKWSNRVMPDPHPNDLRTLGLPVAFSTFGRPRRGYGGYDNCRGFDRANQHRVEEEQQAMQEEYYEDLMLQQNRAQDRAGTHGMSGPSSSMPDHSCLPQWGERQAQHWRNSSNLQPRPSTSKFDNLPPKTGANSFRGHRHNSRGGYSGKFDRSSQMNAGPSQEFDIRRASESVFNGENLASLSNGSSCEPAEEEIAFQNGRLWNSDEYEAYDDDPSWNCDEGANAFGHCSSQFSLGAPIPSSIDHYYYLAPQKQVELKKNGSNSVDPKLATVRKLNYLRRKFRENVCEVCVVGFPRIEQYNKHLRSHAKCVYPDCEFEACIEILDSHITREHLLNPDVNTPISDEEYRRLRKNNYPRKARKELQESMAELQKKRGELLSSKCNKAKDSKRETSKVREKKRPLLSDDTKKLKKSRIEKLKILEIEQNPHESDDNFIVYSRVPEFRGTDAFDEEMGVKSCFADTIQNGDVLFADVPAFHISDDEEDLYPPLVKKEDSFSSFSLPETNNSGVLQKVEGLIKSGSHSNTVQEEIEAAHMTSDGTSAPIMEKSIVSQADPLPCGGALGLLMGDYGSASESESETTDKLASLGSHSPVKSSVLTDVGGSIAMQRDRVVNSRIDKGNDLKMTDENSTNVNDQVGEAGPPPKAEKKNRHRRGKRGLKKRKKPTDCLGTNLADTPCDESIMASSDTVEVNAKQSSENSNMFAPNAFKSCLAASSACVAETRSSLFPHLKASNSRCESDSSDGAVVVAKPWHVRNEKALAARCVSDKYKKFRSKYKKSLLENLLRDQVRFERNALIQCAKYIVDRNFFDGIKESQNITKDEGLEDENSSDSSTDDDSSEDSLSSH